MNSDPKAQFRELHILAAREIKVVRGQKPVIIFIPVLQLKSFLKTQVGLVQELEKIISGQHVVCIAQRRILPKPAHESRTKKNQKRPRSRCALCHPRRLRLPRGEPVRTRTRGKLDGSGLVKVPLAEAQQNNVELKVETAPGV
ncbi:40S ribosomal protein S7-like [Echinops telfairi]|uniref:40S ribosomal protein S7 n=1 Tax=Echinops telfairi TaxID=9371 RepID=A0ABM1VNM9_ECHTE|nr:40S ribosomal protein S7-like [Echinops telfairi]